MKENTKRSTVMTGNDTVCFFIKYEMPYAVHTEKNNMTSMLKRQTNWKERINVNTGRFCSCFQGNRSDISKMMVQPEANRPKQGRGDSFFLLFIKNAARYKKLPNTRRIPGVFVIPYPELVGRIPL